MLFKRFSFQHLPANGIYWLEVSIPETDVKTDASGNTECWYTGKITRKLGMVFFENVKDYILPFMAHPIDEDLCRFDGEVELIQSYSLAALPDLPEQCPAGIDWVEYTGGVDEKRFGSIGWFWVAVKNEATDARHVTLAYHEIREGQIVPGFESPGHTYNLLHELYPGDTVTHIAPLAIPTMPVTIEPEYVPPLDHQRESEKLLTILTQLIGISTGRISHVDNGKCPDVVNGYSMRDDECPACIELLTADAALLNFTAAPITSGKDA